MDNQRNIVTPAARKFVLSRGLPKTGQITSYEDEDDGYIQVGWWKGRRNSNNKTRYRLVTIGGHAVVMDRATGLMWAADGNAAGCNNGAAITWLLALDYASSLTFAGFASDWRVPNIKELLSIVEYDRALYVAGNPLIQEPPFSNTVRSYYWSSTTELFVTSRAFSVTFSQGVIGVFAKIDSYYIRCVRSGL